MVRDLARLADEQFDLLVVGGGIHGLAAAYDAARRGLRVALIERSDFGAALSFNHQRTVHGGLRSLQSGDLARARESIRERRALARIAPHLLRPLPFLMGTSRGLRRNRLALGLGFRLDAFLARDRNVGVVPELHLPAGRLVSRAACQRLFPGLEPAGLTGGATWYDYQTIEPHRLTLAFAIGAAQHGANLANYVEAGEALRSGATVIGVRAHDTLGGAAFDIRARVTLNAAGSHAGRLMAAFGVERMFPLVQTMNVVTTRRASELALAAAGPDGRVLTLVPWHGVALVGTSQSRDVRTPDRARTNAEEVGEFLRQANAAFPALAVGPQDVTLVHHGLVPAVVGRDGVPMLKPRADILDHAADGVQGVVTMVGVKYTTARGVASRAVNRVCRKLGRPRPRCTTESEPLPGAGIADIEALAIESMRKGRLDLDPDVVANLTRLYGSRCPGVLAIAAERPDLAERLAPACPVLKAEIAHAVREEMAQTLGDVVLRRTALGHARHPGTQVVAACAEVLADELGWSEARVTREIAALDAAFGVPPARG